MCTVSIASINTFSSIAINSLKKGFNQSDPRPYIELEIDGVPVPCLFDSGAQLSTMGADFFNEHFRSKNQRFIKTPGPTILGAGNNPLGVAEVYHLPVKRNGKTIMLPFNVVDNNEHNIVGIPAMQALDMTYDAKSQQVYVTDHQSRDVTAISDVVILPHQTRVVKGRFHGTAKSFTSYLATVAISHLPGAIGGPGLTEVDHDQRCNIAITNAGFGEIRIPRGCRIATLEELPTDRPPIRVDQEHLDHFLQAVTQRGPSKVLSHQEIRERANLNVPPEFRQAYLDILLRYKHVISNNKTDLGRSRQYHHRIHLKDQQPVYHPQFPLKPDHQAFIEGSLEEWLKLGVVRRTRSLYNSPIFCVPKKNGQGLRVVQDFRGLNTKTKVDKYSMKEISECIADIGRANSSIFTTLDLTSGFWQMPLHEDSRHLTAFTVKNKGQFEWITSPMGLLGCPASFQRLMEKVMEGVQNTLIYIDDVIIHTQDHPEHLRILELTLQRLAHHGLKINLDKCVFGNKEVAYLGFTLTPKGILPGRDKIKALHEYEPPKSLRQVRGFIGLCNFFRGHVKNFALLSAPLTRLTQNDSGYEQGDLPADALNAFQELKKILTSEPCLAFPRSNLTYALVTEAFPQEEGRRGLLSSALCQFTEDRQCQVLSYASRQLQDHESRYPPFLLEMAAAVEGMEQFDQYLQGRSFLLFMDQRPKTELSHLHKKTMARFADNMDRYSFTIQPKTASILPPFLRTASPVQPGVIAAQAPLLKTGQSDDPDLQSWRHFREHKTWPRHCSQETIDRLATLEPRMYEDPNHVVWVQLPQQTALFLPSPGRRPLVCQVLQGTTDRRAAHLRDLIVTKGYAWPGMEGDIRDHIEICSKCSLASPHADVVPNRQVAMEIFGPFQSYTSARFLMTIHDKATGITEFAPLDSKEPEEVAGGLFSKWISKYGLPGVIKTHLPQNIQVLVQTELRQWLGKHEVTFKHTSDLQLPAPLYDAAQDMIKEAQLSWEDYIPALQFAYNTSYNSVLKNVPFKILFGQDPNPVKANTKSFSDQLIDLRLNFYLEAKQMLDKQVQKDKDSEPNVDNFQVNQEIKFWEKSFGSTLWKGPFKIIQVKPHKVQIQLGPNKTRWLVNQRVRPACEISEKGEVSQDFLPSPQRVSQNFQNLTEAQAIAAVMQAEEETLTQLIKKQAQKVMAGKCLMTQLINQAPLIRNTQASINSIKEADAQTQAYIRTLANRVFTSSAPTSEVLTPQELTQWTKYPVGEINDWLFGHPLLQPEWRPSLCEFDEDFNQEVLAPDPEPPGLPPAPAHPIQIPQPGPSFAPPPPDSSGKSSKRNKGVLRSIRSFTSKARKTVMTKLKTDRNNNDLGPVSTSTFYRGLDPVEFEAAF